MQVDEIDVAIVKESHGGPGKVGSERAQIIVRAGYDSLHTGSESTSIDRPTPWDAPFWRTRQR
jgi:hypothetical protein